MTFPITIVDNFFEDPDAIVKEANTLKYFNPQTGNWPGTRTKNLHLELPRLHMYFTQKLNSIFYEENPHYWETACHFQAIDPMHEDQYHKKNKGWIHTDDNTWFGGIVYLNRDPEPDTGTSIYSAKYGYVHQSEEEIGKKMALYKNLHVDDIEYERAFDAMHDQYVETVTIENVYNRLVVFNNKTHHGVKTYGKNLQRLTLNFFGIDFSGKRPPLQRAR